MGSIMTNKLIDLSHEVENGMITYKGLPAPLICDFLSRDDSKKNYGEGTTFHIGKIEMVANTGTYVDAPFHRFADGADLAELPLERLADLDTIVVPANGAIGAEAVPADVAGRAIVFHTGWSRHFGTPAYASGHPFLTRAAAEALVAGG